MIDAARRARLQETKDCVSGFSCACRDHDLVVDDPEFAFLSCKPDHRFNKVPALSAGAGDTEQGGDTRDQDVCP